MAGRNIIELKGIIKRFYIGQPNELEILHGIDLSVKEGEFVSIVGASGSGKTTLMNIIGVLDRPTEGEYILDGVDVAKAKDRELSGIRNQKIGFVFQTYNLISRTSALRNVELPMMYAGVGKKERQERAKHYLEMVGMQEEFSDSAASILLSESAGSGTAEDGDLTANVTITGVNSDYLEYEELTLLAGRTLTDRDQENAKKVVLVSDRVADNLFGGDYNAAIGSEINIYVSNRYYTYAVVGVYEYDDSGFSTESEEDVTTTVYLPLEAAREQNHSSTGYSQLTIVTAAGVDSTALCDELETWFNNNYYRSNDSFEVTASSMESMVSSMTDMLSTISIAISVIAGISLLVGGIGVMNIMLVSITERTREIGTRKALGATNGSIRLQFIMESIVICLTGGFIGIILGLILAAAATNLLGYAASPSVGGIIFSVTFSILIGVFFGYYPANKAAKMNPIEALRYE